MRHGDIRKRTRGRWVENKLHTRYTACTRHTHGHCYLVALLSNDARQVLRLRSLHWHVRITKLLS